MARAFHAPDRDTSPQPQNGFLRASARRRFGFILPIACLVSIVTIAACGRSRGLTGDQPIPGGVFEASGVAPVIGGRGVLFVDDDTETHVMWLDFDASGRPRPAVPIPLGATIVDPEGMTTDGRFTYIVGSQSKPDGTDGDGLVRFVFDPERRAIRDQETIRGLKGFVSAHVVELAGTAEQFGDHVLNIEGLAWDAERRQLLLGLRAPLAGGDALVVPVALREADGPFALANLHVPGGRAWRVPLGGAGIRGLEYDADAGAFLVLTGAHLDEERLDFRLVRWHPENPAGLEELAVFPRALKPEGIASVTVAGRQRSVVVYDVGRFRVLD